LLVSRADLTRYRRSTGAAFPGSLDRRSIVNIINSQGLRVGVVTGTAIFDLEGQKLYELKGSNIYRLSGELVGHLNATSGSKKRLDRANDRLFPAEGGRI
jgi:hypothetical protein